MRHGGWLKLMKICHQPAWGNRVSDQHIPTVFKVPIGAPSQANSMDNFSVWATKGVPKLHTLLYKMLWAGFLLES